MDPIHRTGSIQYERHGMSLYFLLIMGKSGIMASGQWNMPHGQPS